ncbi:MAG: Rieske (2Fe-2S) protein [Bacteroidetes bacterium]|nr:Rieske (2Fe-2S) protein [Bacteroidota bacterium]
MSLTEIIFTKICSVHDIDDDTGKRFIINETEIAVFKSDGKIFALSNICPHQQTALIYDGIIEDGCVVCPAHGWKFNLQTGNKKSGSRGLDSYEVKIVDENIYVKVVPKMVNW